MNDSGTPYTQTKATKAYGAANFQGMSEPEMMAALMRKLIHQLYMAKDAYVANTLDVMVQRNVKTFEILDVLYTDLGASDAFADKDAALPAAFLLRTYHSLIERLANVLLKEDPAAEYDAIIGVLKELAEAWAAGAVPVASPDMPPPVSANDNA